MQNVIFVEMKYKRGICYRPMNVKPLGSDLYEILPREKQYDFDPQRDLVRFQPGEVVRADYRMTSHGQTLMALEKVQLREDELADLQARGIRDGVRFE